MAFDLNGTIGPIISGVILLMPTMLDLVVNVVPIILTLAVVKFVMQFWDQIIGMLKF
jgi:hypothetical protein